MKRKFYNAISLVIIPPLFLSYVVFFILYCVYHRFARACKEGGKVEEN